MSKEEAIEILSDIRSEYNLFGDTEEATRYHSLSWAIKAMSQPEIIRCKDCKNRYAISIDVFPGIIVHGCDYMSGAMGDADFCSKGERRE